MAVSQNGWPVSPPRSARQIGDRGVKVTVADGPAGDVLVWVCTQIDRRVEDIDLDSTRGEFDDWGYADRTVRGSTSISNHASATAVDINATRHGLGKVGTFNARQVAELHKILREVDNVVRWGGDYTGRRDEMHFEINATPEQVARVAARLDTTGGAFMPGLTDQQQKNLYTRVMGMLPQRWWAIRNGVAQKVPAGSAGAKPCAVLDTLDGSFIVTRIGQLTARVVRAEAEIKAARGEQITEAQVRAAVDAELGEVAGQWAAMATHDEPAAGGTT